MEDRQIRIERYLAGDGDATERAVFAAELAADAELRAEVELHRKLAATFGDPEEMALRRNLDQIRAEGLPSSFPRWAWWLLGVLLLAGLTWLLVRFTAPAAAPEHEVLRSKNPYVWALIDSLPATNITAYLTPDSFHLRGKILAVAPPDNLQLYAAEPLSILPLTSTEIPTTIIAFGGRREYALTLDTAWQLPPGQYYFLVRTGEQVLAADRLPYEQ